MKLYSDSFYYHCTIHQSDQSLPYLLMLHGFMGSEKVFDHLLNDLKSFCNPITVDLAGHGQTISPSDPEFYSTERQISQLHSVLQRLHFETLFLYGYSLGGRLAFQLVTRHPKLFAGVTIESSHCGIQSQTERTERLKTDENRAQQIEDNFDGFIDQWIDLPLFKHTPSNMRSIYKKVMYNQDPKCIAASIRGFGSGFMPSVCDQIKKISIPLTFIAGEKDQKYVERMTSIKKKCHSASLHIIKNAGHRVHADQPEHLIEILGELVR